MTSQVASISGTISAGGFLLNAAGGNFVQQFADVMPTLFLGGGLTGTIQVLAKPTGPAFVGVGYSPVTPVGASSPNITAPGVYAFPPLGGDWEFVIYCTVFTSGSAPVYLGLSPAV